MPELRSDQRLFVRMDGALLKKYAGRWKRRPVCFFMAFGADGALELVDTNLAASKSEEWDYEVTAGI